MECDTGHDLPADILFEKSGPHKQIFFEPRKTRAAIVTRGGLGLNNVIRSAYPELQESYGVMEVWNIRYSYAGLNAEIGEPAIRLTPSLVNEIHEIGTMLGMSRGPQPIEAMVNFFVDHEI